MKSKNKKKLRRSTILLFALIVLIIGIFVVSYNYLASKKQKVYDSMNISLFEDETPKNIKEGSNDSEKSQRSKEKANYNYVGTLKISKINLSRGFLDKKSPYNTIERNVTLNQSSTYPDEEYGNVILTAHSGICPVCFFDKLYKLEKGDKAEINYNNILYTYKLVNIYNVQKTGEVMIQRDPLKSVLTLITCTHNSDTEQTVYIFELEKKKKN